MEKTESRKLDHIRVVLDSLVEEPGAGLLEDLELVYNALPELSLEDVDASTVFLGRRLNAPLMVAGMTGGHSAAADVNCAIAEAVEELGLAMGVGSQRAAIENPALSETYRVARRCAPNAPIVANLGAPQLAEGYGVEEVAKAVEMLEADAVAIHLNPGQEAFQPEGDTNYRGVVRAIARIAEAIDVPVIVKETGQGLSYEAVYALSAAGIKFFDVAGLGGTSWVLVESHRASAQGMSSLASSAKVFSRFGVPTARAVAEARWAAPHACIIASGGVRSGLDAAKLIAFGADMAAMALPVLHAYARGGAEAVKELLSRVVRELRTAMFLSGVGSLAELRRAKLLLSQRLSAALQARGVDVELYLKATRLVAGPGAACAGH